VAAVLKAQFQTELVLRLHSRTLEGHEYTLGDMVTKFECPWILK